MNNAAFKQFLADNGLSTRSLADYCKGTYISKSTMHRLTQPDAGGSQPNFLKRIVPPLIQSCQRWMVETGKPTDEINRVLEEIFEEDYEPMITERSHLNEEMQEFFGLKGDPFAAENDPKNADEVMTTRELDRIVRTVESAVMHQDFVCVLGPVGSGKTTLKNRIADRLKKQGKTHLIFPKFAEMGKLNSGGIVHYVLEHFGQTGRIRLPLAQRQLERHLENLTERGERVSLFFDEIHRVNDVTLSALKNFLELGTGGYERFLSIILFGQPRFKKEKLENVDFREIAERVQVLDMPSVAKYAADYIRHRVKLAGGSVEKLFEPAVIEAIAAKVQTPLAIGNLANLGLIAAFQKGDSKVTLRHLTKDQEPVTRKLKAVGGAA